MESNLRSASEAGARESLHKMSFSDWCNALEGRYGLSCERHRGHAWDVELDERGIGELRVAEVCMRGQTLASRRAMLAAQDQLYVKLVLRGAVTFEQNGEQRRFPAGSLVIVDPSRPFLEVVDDEAQLIVVTCQKSALRERGYQSQFNHWVAPNMRSPDVHVMQGMVRLIAGCSSAVSLQTQILLGAQLLDFMDVLLSMEASSLPRTSAAILFRVKRYIAEHLGDVSLDADSIATGVHLSVSYLNRLFRGEGTSLMRYLWSQRLDRAYQLVNSSKRSGLRIEDIAWHCGFSSAAHFSRLFKQQYQLSPRKLRDESEQVTLR